LKVLRNRPPLSPDPNTRERARSRRDTPMGADKTARSLLLRLGQM
jgi:hypothetical protein